MAESLPKLVDVRKLIAAGVELHVTEPLKAFKRVHDMLAVDSVENDDGDVDIQLHCFIDAQGKRRIDGHVQTTVMIPCQRCLQPMPFIVDSKFAVAAVWSEEDAEHLPKHLDAYVVGEGLQDVRTLIEDELIISLPYVSYHELDECEAAPYSLALAPVDDVSAEASETRPAAKENPFKVLEQLKSGK